MEASAKVKQQLYRCYTFLLAIILVILIAVSVGAVFADDPTFEDVPFDHPYYPYIEALYQNGYVAGCSESPMLFCTGQGMSRAEGAVFLSRGVEGAEFHPLMADTAPFADVFLSDWFVEWVNDIKMAGFTDGCGVNARGDLIYCPNRIHTRAEAATFFVRMLEGPDFVPPTPDPDHWFKIDDVARDDSVWYNKWIYYAWEVGITHYCESSENLLDNLFRPDDPILREEAACMTDNAINAAAAETPTPLPSPTPTIGLLPGD